MGYAILTRIRGGSATAASAVAAAAAFSASLGDLRRPESVEPIVAEEAVEEIEDEEAEFFMLKRLDERRM
jgi:hypothetical protein